MSIKSLFIKDEPEAKPKPVAQPASFREPTPSLSILPDRPSPPISADKDVLRNLTSRIYPNTGPLSAFMASFNSLADIIPEETIRLAAAVQICKAQGGSTASLIVEIGAAENRLAAEKQTAEQQKTAKYNAEVVAREARVAALTQDILARTAERDALAKQLDVAKQEFENKALTYDAAFTQIADDLEHIATKLKGVK